MKLCNLPYGLRITAKKRERIWIGTLAQNLALTCLADTEKHALYGRKDDGRKTDAPATTVKSELKRKLRNFLKISLAI